MYELWLGNIRLPVAPEKINIATGSLNQIVTLVEGGEINLLKSPKLRTIKFDALIPNANYPFAYYGLEEFKNADYFKEKIIALKESKQPFSFVITRIMGNKIFNYTDISSTLESYNFIEDAKDGFDLKISIELREYRNFGAFFTNEGAIETNSNKKVEAKTYTVLDNDNLWKIAKKIYGDGSKHKLIYEANRGIIANPNVIKKGMILEIPQ